MTNGMLEAPPSPHGFFPAPFVAVRAAGSTTITIN
jgi:hypothetical protein